MKNILIVVFAIVIGVLFWLDKNLNGLIRNAIISYGSEMTQAKVSVGSVKLDVVNGEGVIRQLMVNNPKNFKTEHAFKVKEFSIVIDMSTIADNVVLVKRIVIDAPDIIYEKGETLTNFELIQKNIENYLGASGQQSSGKKLIVDTLTIHDIKAQASAPFMAGDTVALNLSDITLHNLGKSKGGITPGELGQAVAGALEQKMSEAISFDRLSKAVSENTDSLVKSTKDGVSKFVDLF